MFCIERNLRAKLREAHAELHLRVGSGWTYVPIRSFLVFPSPDNAVTDEPTSASRYWVIDKANAAVLEETQSKTSLQNCRSRIDCCHVTDSGPHLRQIHNWILHWHANLPNRYTACAIHMDWPFRRAQTYVPSQNTPKQIHRNETGEYEHVFNLLSVNSCCLTIVLT